MSVFQVDGPSGNTKRQETRVFAGVPVAGIPVAAWYVPDFAQRTITGLDVQAAQGPYQGDAVLTLTCNAVDLFTHTVSRVAHGLPATPSPTEDRSDSLGAAGVYLYATTPNAIGGINATLYIE